MFCEIFEDMISLASQNIDDSSWEVGSFKDLVKVKRGNGAFFRRHTNDHVRSKTVLEIVRLNLPGPQRWLYVENVIPEKIQNSRFTPEEFSQNKCGIPIPKNHSNAK